MTADPQRLPSLDVIRGFALLGILTMNMTLALPGAARLIPTASGGFEGANFALWAVGYLFFDEKMISLFSMLFGASLYLFGQKNPGFGWLLRRQAALLAIGLVHAYLIWEGDILVSYAFCGVIVYPLRNLPLKRLVTVALLTMLPSIVFSAAFGQLVLGGAAAAAQRVDSARAAGKTPSASDVEASTTWRSLTPTPAEIERVAERGRSRRWLDAVRERAPEAFSVQVMIFPISFLWTISARMLLGIALLRFSLLSRDWTAVDYWRRARIFWLAGFPIVVATMLSLLARNFDPVFLFSTALTTNQIGAICIAAGYACLLMTWVRSGRFQPVLTRIAAAGRLSLTNYLAQSLIATWIFGGYGLGQFGKWQRVELAGLVVAIWILQLLWSPWWLERFAYGPAEWLWRLATFGRLPRWRRELA